MLRPPSAQHRSTMRFSPWELRVLAVLDALQRGGRLPTVAAPQDGGFGGTTFRWRREFARVVERRVRRIVVRWLARAGWRRESFFQDESPMTGRLWERRPHHAMPLRFTRATWDLVSSFAGCETPAPTIQNSSSGDEVFRIIVRSDLRGRSAAIGSDGGSSVRIDALFRAVFPIDVPDSPPSFDSSDPVAEARDIESDFSRWFAPDTQWILEALQHPLADAWRDTELEKRDWTDAARLRTAGAAQRLLLDAWLWAADAAGRRDLALWIVSAARRALDDADASAFEHGHAAWFRRAAAWATRVGESMPAGERSDVVREALALFQSFDRLTRWTYEARRTGFVDEGYASARFWLNAWDRCDGEAVAARARALVESATQESASA